MIRTARRFVSFGLLLLGASPLFAQPANEPTASKPDTSSSGASKPAAVNYARDIKPLLQQRCYACHGALQQQSGLRLDTADLLLKGGDSGPVVMRGDSAKSALIERVSSTDREHRMPPEGEGEALSAEQIQILRRWIDAGSPAPDNEQPEADPRDHWSFRSVVRPAVPAVANRDWPRTAIDAFVARQHEQHGLTPQVEAPREILLRRLYFDLIGLPPSVDEIRTFQQDTAPDWYERAVDRLLSDPRHGERWGRHWMDIWRYSDWWGLGDQLRNSQKHIWHWRDWIIESLNGDLPYDEMVRLMLAADESHPNDLDRLRATGYLARNYFLFNRNQWMDETIEHVGKSFLGLTLNCAKCHEHKFDPVGQIDFYRMRAIFEPYHVRLDVLPGEPDLNRDGIPRVFDSSTETPTYRYVRGQESQPDKSRVIEPGVPTFLEFKKLAIAPIDLPPETWQPERREWVLDAHRAAAERAVKAAEAAAEAAAAQTQEKLNAGATPEKATPEKPAPEKDAELRVAAENLAVARAEAASVERRVAALRAAWNVERAMAGTSPEVLEPLKQAEQQAREAAVAAERQVPVAKARQTLANVELRLLRAAADKKEPIEKELKTARETLEKTIKAAEAPVQPSDTFTRFVGAQWTATRFFSSGKDDPAMSQGPRSTGRRTALAQWITDRQNPLTARVAVNHLWARHMGAPLVATVFDFGRKGSSPTHPELLDWMAAELMDSGWSMKHLHHLIVNSAAYRMSSSAAGREANLAKDTDNRHLWRRAAGRLESQVLRDAILALAGSLELKRGGPPVPPANQADSRRRSLYFFHSNNDRNLFLTTFDEALVKDCYRREQSIVPQQALALTNSRLVLDASQRIAQQLAADNAPADGTLDDAAFIRAAFLVVVGIKAGDAELTASQRALDAWRKLPGAPGSASSPASTRSAGSARSAGTGGADPARANLVWVLLNHNDFVTLR